MLRGIVNTRSSFSSFPRDTLKNSEVRGLRKRRQKVGKRLAEAGEHGLDSGIGVILCGPCSVRQQQGKKIGKGRKL